ncbi:GNAT family protein [Paraburkholderia sp. PREW-6R]|uniref:GNAT family N-acetyltransferase n=1 Tax=Paraburkholderia sp. PREW-6R TaxID=3141544 RepID=UPI0031F49947
MNHNTIIVRQLGLADRDAYFQLRLRGLKTHPDSFGQSYEEALAQGASQHDATLQGSRAAQGDFLLGASLASDAPLVGVVGLLRNGRDKERHKAAVVGMYVAPEAGGRGVGRALLTDLVARAGRVSGLLQIQLLVGTHNHAARNLYESFGFRKYGCEIGALKVGDAFYDADLMARFL